MTLLNTERDSGADSATTLHPTPEATVASLGPGRQMLHRRIDDAVKQATRSGRDDELSAFVAAAVAAFFEVGEPHGAAKQVASLCRDIGSRQARRGDDVDDLAEAFRTARVAAQRGLSLAIDDAICGDDLRRLREELVVYLRLLFGHASAGLTCTRRLMDVSDTQRLDLLRDHLFNGTARAPLPLLLSLCGIEASTLRPIVSRSGKLPTRLTQHDGVVVGRDRREALVPADWSAEQIGRLAGVAVALGPVTALDRMTEAVRLTRTAARSGTDRDCDVSVDDVLGSLVLLTTPLLGDLLVERHLGPLLELPTVRRIPLAETLLTWLETGQPVNVVARQIGIPNQTAHSRIASARKTFGSLLDDADGRLELIVALRTALPRWSAAA